MRLEPRNLNEEVDKESFITSPRVVNEHGRGSRSAQSTFADDGVFSQCVFGNLGGGHGDYACSCGATTGKFNEGLTCDECHTEVLFRNLALEKEGWIDLGITLIHPLFYRYLCRLIGKTAMERIISYKPSIHLNGELIETPFEFPYANIGMRAFTENYETIVTDFGKRKHNQDLADMLIRAKELVLINYFPIINARLRPAILVGSELSFDVINNYYNSILSGCETLKSLSSIERTPIMIEPLAFKMQMGIQDVYTNILKNLDDKEGFIRDGLLSNRLNYTSRMVITPLTGDYNLDEVVLPYRVAVELLRPQLVRNIRKLKSIPFSEANEFLNKALMEVNPLVLSLVRKMLKKKNIGLLVNRNPTINIGSIMYIPNIHVKEDLSDNTCGIHNLLLKPLNGDYDGDVLAYIMVYGKEFNDLFRPFKPSNLLIDFDTTGFNSAFLPTKDTSLGLETLLL